MFVLARVFLCVMMVVFMKSVRGRRENDPVSTSSAGQLCPADPIAPSIAPRGSNLKRETEQNAQNVGLMADGCTYAHFRL